MSDTLIVYYSRKGENYWNGSIKNLAKGNTEIIAEMIADITGGDLFQVETVKEYPADCDQLNRYKNLFICYPNWWGSMPMAMFTFLEHYDLTDKHIFPLCTNEGSGMGSSERDLKKICKGAIVEKGLSIHGAEAADSRGKVEAWIKKVL